VSNKKVFVSGCYDLLHSGHVEFFRQASQFGDLYVGIGSDKTIQALKGHKTMYSEQERLFMVRAIRYVKEAYINQGEGYLDFLPTLDLVHPDCLVVNEDGDRDDKRQLCRERGMEYIVLKRVPGEGLQARSSTGLKQSASQLPTRLDLAGTWIDQPYVSCHAPGWALTISLEPTFEIRERCGLSTSTRNTIKRVWPYQLPTMDPEMLARLVFCLENDPERSDGIVSGAQDAIGICVPGLARHYYNGSYWPEKIEYTQDPTLLQWLEDHLCMIPMFPRRPGCSVVEGKDITPEKVRALAAAADRCWTAIQQMNLEDFASAYKASFEAQVAMFPAMIQPGVQDYIDRYSVMPGVMAWKMPGAGGGGYLALVCRDRDNFPEGAISLSIRRGGF
jgi:cytidyltransferase-like protein